MCQQLKGDLLANIEHTRNLMIEVGLKYGLSNSKTVKISQELDRLFNILSEGHKEKLERMH